MKTQIKVTDTRMHKIFQGERKVGPAYERVPVAEGILMLVECISKDALFNKYLGDSLVIHDNKYGAGRKYFKPIIISETEKIEVGAWMYNIKNHVIRRCDEMDCVFNDDKDWFKIIALPEHFSPKHLQAIVDGKMKDGDKVLVECEFFENAALSKIASVPNGMHIKLNSSNHVTLHKVEEKMYTRDEVKTFAWYAVQHSSKLESKGQKVIHRKDIDSYLDSEMV
jgi:hypothetical protein